MFIAHYHITREQKEQHHQKNEKEHDVSSTSYSLLIIAHLDSWDDELAIHAYVTIFCLQITLIYFFYVMLLQCFGILLLLLGLYHAVCRYDIFWFALKYFPNKNCYHNL